MARPLSWLVVLTLVLGVVACGGESNGTGSSTTAKPALRYQFEKGATLRYLNTTENKTEGGMMNFNQHQEQGLLWEVQEVDAEGTATIHITYESVKARMESPQGVMEFDSTKDEGSGGDPFGQTMSAFVGKTVAMKVDPFGKVLEVDGFSAILEPALKDNPMADFVRGTFNDEAMGQMMQNSMALLPDTEPEVGDSWSQAYSAPAGMLGTMSVDVKNSIDSIQEVAGDKLAKILILGTFDMSAIQAPEDTGENPMAAMLSQMKVSDGKVDGEVVFDMSHGRVETQRTTVTMVMEMMGQQMKSTATTTVKRVD